MNRLWLVVALACVHALVAAAQLPTVTPMNDVFTSCNDCASYATMYDTVNGGPGYPTRRYAMVHVAQFNAWNAIKKQYQVELFTLQPSAPAGASATAAAAQACRDVLVSTDPSMSARWDEWLAGQLAKVADGDKETGIRVGQRAAADTIYYRMNDRVMYGNMPWNESTDKCAWHPDPLTRGQTSWGYGWGGLKMWALPDVDNVPYTKPPPMTSPQFAMYYNEVYMYGMMNSPSRTQQQLEMGKWWSYDSKCLGYAPALYNRHLQEIAYQQKNTQGQNALLLALANVAMADTTTAAWYQKYMFDIGRPITVIRSGCAQQYNKDLPVDANWVPYGARCGGACEGDVMCTPAFPADPSEHAALGAAAYYTTRMFYGKDFSFWATSQEPNAGPARREFNSLEDAIAQNAQSRIYLGIHWGSDRDNGVTLGKYAGSQVATRYPMARPPFEPRRPAERVNAPLAPARASPNEPRDNNNNNDNNNSAASSLAVCHIAVVALVMLALALSL